MTEEFLFQDFVFGSELQLQSDLMFHDVSLKRPKEIKEQRSNLGTGEQTEHVLTIYQQIGHKKRKRNVYRETNKKEETAHGDRNIYDLTIV